MSKNFKNGTLVDRLQGSEKLLLLSLSTQLGRDIVLYNKVYAQIQDLSFQDLNSRSWKNYK